MRVHRGAAAAVLVVSLLLGGAAYLLLHPREGPDPFRSRIGREPHRIDGGVVHISCKAKGNNFKVLLDGSWKDILVKGVNMGMAKPGFFPGEAAITYDEYYRWFSLISEMNANVVRVYTVHPPSFYDALYDHNRRSDEPLFIIQGIYIPEEDLLRSGDALQDTNNRSFIGSIRTTIDVVHGNAELLQRPGHASGTYDRDISHYVLGYVLGIEWDPTLISDTNKLHQDVSGHDGRYIRTEGSTPFEVWLTSMMDHAAEYETSAYSEQRPLSFINWPTTDKYDHPYEPFYHEDLVSLDPEVMVPTWNMVPGLFATYHVYPYYPDFMTLEPKYLDHTDADGEKDGYAGYLHELRGTHSMPVLVGEFGVPSSRGIAHEGLDGRDHGHMTEEEQGRVLSDLFLNIVSEGLAGGLVFSWQDEWFKRTWNTMDLTEPDRRACWMDVQTCEQHFGLLAFDPASAGTRAIDGSADDWRAPSSLRAAKDGGPLLALEDGYDGQRNIKGLMVSNDEAYINIAIETGAKSGINWDRMELLLLIDTIPDQGSTIVPFGTGLKSEVGFDFIVRIRGEGSSEVLVDSYYDLHHFYNGHMTGYIEEDGRARMKDNGVFVPVLMAVNRGFTVPATGEKVPYKAFRTGKLAWGRPGMPEGSAYSKLVDICSSMNGSFIELRLPYLLLNIRDPSTRMVNADPWTDGYGKGKTIDGVRIAAVTFMPGKDGRANDAKDTVMLTDSIPQPTGGVLMKEDLPMHTWEGWYIPIYSERTKVSYGIMEEVFSHYNGPMVIH